MAPPDGNDRCGKKGTRASKNLEIAAGAIKAAVRSSLAEVQMNTKNSSLLPVDASFTREEQALFDELLVDAEVEAIVNALFPQAEAVQH